MYCFTRFVTAEIAQGLEQSYKDALNLQVKEMFSPFIKYCEQKNVSVDNWLR